MQSQRRRNSCSVVAAILDTLLLTKSISHSRAYAPPSPTLSPLRLARCFFGRAAAVLLRSYLVHVLWAWTSRLLATTTRLMKAPNLQASSTTHFLPLKSQQRAPPFPAQQTIGATRPHPTSTAYVSTRSNKRLASRQDGAKHSR